MFEERITVAISIQEHRQIPFNVCLCKAVRNLFEIQYRLRNLQAIGVDSTIRVLSQAEFFSEKRNAVPEFGYTRNRPVQVCIGHKGGGEGD